MELITSGLSKICNISPNLIIGMSKRSSVTWRVQRKADLDTAGRKSEKRWTLVRVLMYLYLSVAVGRFWLLAYGQESWFGEYFLLDKLFCCCSQSAIYRVSQKSCEFFHSFACENQ